MSEQGSAKCRLQLVQGAPGGTSGLRPRHPAGGHTQGPELRPLRGQFRPQRPQGRGPSSHLPCLGPLPPRPRALGPPSPPLGLVAVSPGVERSPESPLLASGRAGEPCAHSDPAPNLQGCGHMPAEPRAGCHRQWAKKAPGGHWGAEETCVLERAGRWSRGQDGPCRWGAPLPGAGNLTPVGKLQTSGAGAQVTSRPCALVLQGCHISSGLQN